MRDMRPSTHSKKAMNRYTPTSKATAPKTVSIIGLSLALVFSAVLPIFAQGTPIPYTIPQYFDANGNPLASGGICTYEAGTTTLTSVYTNSTLTVAHPNPVRLNAAGRPTVSNVTLPIFLATGRSYKFVLKDSTVTTCSPDTGVTLWSVDNVQAVPGSGVSVDVDATAGEAITSGQAVYLSDGSGGKNAGQWYLADADFTYASTTPEIGIAVASIASGTTGTVRISGRSTNQTGLSAGTVYYVSATPGALTNTAPANSRFVGQADTATSLITTPDPPVSSSGIAAVIDPKIKTLSNGRLTLTTNVPVTVSDVTAATTVYWTPYTGNTIALYSGTTWQTFTLSELSIAVPATTNTAYDLFIDWDATTPTLTLLAWTNLTTRATALTTQDGVLVLTGSLTRRYVGSFRTTGVSGQTESSAAKRYLWNYYNRVPLELFIADATASWTYTTATIRQARATATNQVEVMVGVQEAELDLMVLSSSVNSSGVSRAVGIGEDSTSTFATGAAGMTSGDTSPIVARLVKKPAIGSHTYSWNEWSAATGTTTWYGTSGDSTPAGVASGLRGWIDG
jgi:hypothetical protein